jgi:hypothetical protein
VDPDIEICAEATDGLEAVQTAQECHPDLAVRYTNAVEEWARSNAGDKEIDAESTVLLFTLHSSL